MLPVLPSTKDVRVLVEWIAGRAARYLARKGYPAEEQGEEGDRRAGRESGGGEGRRLLREGSGWGQAGRGILNADHLS